MSIWVFLIELILACNTMPEIVMIPFFFSHVSLVHQEKSTHLFCSRQLDFMHIKISGFSGSETLYILEKINPKKPTKTELQFR